MAKSMQRAMKMARVKTWKAKPATMMLSPVSGLLFWCVAVEAIPPPAACRRRLRRSHGMNYFFFFLDLVYA